MKPAKHLIEILKKHSGRDSTGSISVRHQGGRHKRYYRIIDFKRDKFDVVGTVLTVEYDPNRNSRISLVEYADGEKRYILQPKDLKVGDKVISSDNPEMMTGNAAPLRNIPIGTGVHNIELRPGQGGKMVRGAGGTAIVVAKDESYAQIKLPSGSIRLFLLDCRATVGMVGNIEHKDELIGTAGRKRRMGIRPTVRGVAQDPRSHPHGGGEGKSGEGMHPKTPWGKSARGTRTRPKVKWSNRYIVKRRSI
ncbi:MAG: 50S ribosomal protein L2 [Microgenomates group bacterium]|jgi:large subunit ribosomal protein L2|nr:50S ribosomal protein L2 [Candidatus Woesebacteria bacterium]MBP6882853.1 50S ribosomal protein L2 [Candidatus Woesebacteria bacterium]